MKRYPSTVKIYFNWVKDLLINDPLVENINVIREIVLSHSCKGNVILDPFMGSGTTAVACKQLNRNFIGFELSQEYVDIANKRLKQQNLNDWYSQ